MSDKIYGWSSKSVDFEELKGLTIVSVDGAESGSDEIVFTLSDGIEFKMYHDQDCCESVLVEDVCGDIQDITNAQIIHFEERIVSGDTDWGSYTATFYDIQTTKGCVNIRWNGESNGYYSESVSVRWPEC
jgi:Fe-S cluster biogenesis protein NfuA